MCIFNFFNNKIVIYDLINKFNYNNNIEFPKFKKIILTFNLTDNFTIKKLLSAIFSFELVLNQKHILLKSKKNILNLKIKKGNPIGGKITLRKKVMFCFLELLIFEILPSLKQFYGFKLNNLNITENTFSFILFKSYFVKDLENFYLLFKDLPFLNVTIVTNCNSKLELIFLLRSIKVPLYFN